MSTEEQLTYPEALEQLRGSYEREKIQLTSHISSLQVTVNQQSIQIKRLEQQLHKEQDCYA